jgi:hypothetical protein
MSKVKKPPVRFPKQAPLELITFQDHQYTWCGVRQGTDQLVAEGWAHREREDEFDQNVGMMLATGRALEALSKKLMKRANGLVKHHDDMREYRQERTVQEWQGHQHDLSTHLMSGPLWDGLLVAWEKLLGPAEEGE